MRLITYVVEGQPRAGVATDDRIFDVERASGGVLPSDPASLLALEDWPARLAALRDGHGGVERDGWRLLAPQPRPTKIVAVGLNYRKHCEESGAAIPQRPLLFAKWPSAIVGPDARLELPEDDSDQVDYEVELAVVMGRRCSKVPAERALGYVGGYTVANDISARDWQERDGQWTLAKSFDGFCPLGPAIVTTDEIPDPQALALATTVNGAPRQSSSTADMMFSVAELIEYLSARVTLLPGDLIITGTPSGVGLGFDPPKWLRPGDVVRCEIERIGELRTDIVAGSGP